MIVTLPAPVAEMLEELIQAPLESVPVPHEEPMTVSKPELVVTLDVCTMIPTEKVDAFAAVPVIVTLPAPVAEILADDFRKTPMEFLPVPHEVPLTVSDPELFVTVAPDA